MQPRAEYTGCVKPSALLKVYGNYKYQTSGNLYLYKIQSWVTIEPIHMVTIATLKMI